MHHIKPLIFIKRKRRRGCDRMVVGFTTIQSLPITTNVASSNPAYAECTRCNIM